MPESAEEYAARIAAAQDADGRLRLDPDGVLAWDVFPFEAEGLRVKPGPVLVDEEPPRRGEEASDCHCTEVVMGGPAATGDWAALWEGMGWRVKLAPPSGSPLVLVAEPLEHLDVDALTDDLAAALGRLQVALVGAVEALPSVARCHVLRIGDGGAHAHVWFVARPARMPQLRGSFMVVWDDLLPPVPAAVGDANAAFVVERLVRRLGGRPVTALA
ncbi:hypothetical protein KMZ32_16145 [Phycicoccus sp. MAQZ13P-2]|uniref:hypothetical protein n=1 Tax=Phycicoccus mangrovi TaxID=2840470 RepID=UPI001C000AE4|nr:hypothetical protein [Phycicoccus mangrovi]MBT9253977.1 hypothetical protein [Phycicoccus mangrovi]MBT9275610.1 hypothetical protein [Phycicoccus mangrovi]